MSEFKFKVGDKVKVIKDNEYRNIGERGTVVKIDELDCMVEFTTVDVFDNHRIWMFEDDLKLINETKEDEIKEVYNKLKFKIGDKVRIIEGDERRNVGEVGIIIDANKSYLPYRVEFDTIDNDNCYYRNCMFEEQLELVSRPNEQATTYNINELCEKPQQVLGNFESIAINANQPLKDAFKELLNISEQLSEFNKKNNTKLRIIVE